MFRILRCFNISTSERPDALLLVAWDVSSAKRDGEDDDGLLEIDTTSPNCAELFRRIGVTSPNRASVVAVTFDRALVSDKDSSFTLSELSESS